MSLRHAILGLLNYAPQSGYGLKQVFDKSIHYIWSAKQSQIYRELAGMEKDGWVSSLRKVQNTRPDKKVYALTPKGKKALRDWLAEFPVAFGLPRRDEFLLRVFFASEMDKDLLVRELKDFAAAIRAYEAIIDEGQLPAFLALLGKSGEGLTRARLRDLGQRESPYWSFTVRRFREVGRASLRWAEACIKDLEAGS